MVPETSIAKIFARAINCKNSHDGIQCENCDSCIISKEKELSKSNALI